MLPVKNKYFEKMLVIFNSGPINKIGEIVNDGKLMENSLPKFVRFDKVIENNEVKLLTKLVIDASENVIFNLKTDGKINTFTTYKKGVNEFMFKMIAKDVSFEITSNEENSVVENVSLEYYEY